jgi:hypothetical protein
VPLFSKPSFSYECEGDAQLKTVGKYEATGPGRDIPDKAPDNLLLATWNVANLGLQERRAEDCQLSAEIVSWFDVVALHVGAAGTLPSSERTEACLGC